MLYHSASMKPHRLLNLTLNDMYYEFWWPGDRRNQNIKSVKRYRHQELSSATKHHCIHTEVIWWLQSRLMNYVIHCFHYVKVLGMVMCWLHWPQLVILTPVWLEISRPGKSRIENDICILIRCFWKKKFRVKYNLINLLSSNDENAFVVTVWC